jgi:hypothetical protein
MQGYEDLLGIDEIKACEQDVYNMEVEFSGANNDNVKEHYKTQFGITGEQAIIEKSKKDKQKSKNYQMELAVTALLYKVLSDRYFIARTSKYDDYVNGIDNIIVDKETGTVVCAFDEVHEGGDGQRTAKKEQKILKSAKKGGAKIHFGLGMNDGQLQRTELKNLPVFYLGLDTDHLNDLIEDMSTEGNGSLSKTEQLTFELLMQSVSKQIENISDQKDIPQAVLENLNKFKESFAGMPRYNSNLI